MSLKAIGEQVLQVLLDSGREDKAKRLARELKAAQGSDPKRRDKALRTIIGWCHVKALGDVYIKRLTLNEWWGQLSKLEAAAERGRRKTKPRLKSR